MSKTKKTFLLSIVLSILLSILLIGCTLTVGDGDGDNNNGSGSGGSGSGSSGVPEIASISTNSGNTVVVTFNQKVKFMGARNAGDITFGAVTTTEAASQVDRATALTNTNKVPIAAGNKYWFETGTAVGTKLYISLDTTTSAALTKFNTAGNMRLVHIGNGVVSNEAGTIANVATTSDATAARMVATVTAGPSLVRVVFKDASNVLLFFDEEVAAIDKTKITIKQGTQTGAATGTATTINTAAAATGAQIVAATGASVSANAIDSVVLINYTTAITSGNYVAVTLAAAAVKDKVGATATTPNLALTTAMVSENAAP